MSNQQTLITSIKHSDVYSIVYLQSGESLVKKTICLVLFVLTLFACASIKEITSIGSYHVSTDHLEYFLSPLDKLNDKTTVVFVVSEGGTEIFDLLAPYEIFAQSGKYRLIVAAPEKAVVPLWKGIGIVPHATFDELDSKPGFRADVIVLPNIMDEENERVREWIQANVDQSDYVLSICEGIRLIGNAEVFKDSVVTTHAESIGTIKDKYDGYQWVNDKRYVKSGRLISTAGVSAAVEGTLALLAEMHGQAHAEVVRQKIGYPFAIYDARSSPQPINFDDIGSALKKVMFSDNLELGFLIRQGVSEMKLAAVLDTYARTLPASMVSVTENDEPIISQHGLKFVPKGTLHKLHADELHVLGGSGQALPKGIDQKNLNVYYYEGHDNYALAELLSSMDSKYNKGFVDLVAKWLDYPIERLQRD